MPDAVAHAVAQKREQQARQQAQHPGDGGDVHGQGQDGNLGHRRHIHNAYVADLACRDQLELLRTVEQACIQFSVNLHVARHAQIILFDRRERFHAVVDRVQFIGQAPDLHVNGLDIGMLRAKTRIQV